MSASEQRLSDLATNASYNPLESYIMFTSVYGEDTAVKFADVQSLVDENLNQAIVFGTRCGAAIVTLIMMWMISKNRKTPVFIINQVSLTLVLISSALYFRYLLSGFGSITYVLTGFPQLISDSDLRAYAASNIVQVLLVASIEASLIFQVKVVFSGEKLRKVGMLLTSFSVALGLATVAMYFVTAIKSIISLYSDLRKTSDTYYNVSLILLASSINIMTLILVVKLILAIRSRRFLGLKQFDSFHILLIVSCQTLLIPSILFILAYSLPKGRNTDVLISVAILVVVLSLPLSSMWASAANNFSNANTSPPEFSSGSSGYYSKGTASLYSESGDEKGRKGIRQVLYARTHRKSNGNGLSDVDSSMFAELSKPVTHDGADSVQYLKAHPDDTPTKKIDTVVALYTPSTTIEEDERKFWAGDYSGSSNETTPVKKSTDENMNIPPYLLRYDDSRCEGIEGTKKISLKK